MARKKRTSPVIQRAENRAAGIDSIDEALDLGNNLTQAKFKAKVKEVGLTRFGGHPEGGALNQSAHAQTDPH